MFRLLRRPRQEGQVLVLSALILPVIIGVFMIGLVDTAYMYINYSDVSQVAFLAARAGATAIDVNSLDNGVLALDRVTAKSQCQGYINANYGGGPGAPILLNRGAECSVNMTSGIATSVTATVKLSIHLPIPFPIGNKVLASYTSCALYGVDTQIKHTC